uniref:Uncharacterized protein n=1 Tax=Podoviridae sp. ctOAf25 TaxID=2825245 RepID=A0A8S5PNN1_9CAUD|nr:MAG TPA: hypothetical protein [Podoviridae sp. ctOAf25]DAM79075.1 MAG TPA: hypothetical protein [Caudoviricetes sp.]
MYVWHKPSYSIVLAVHMPFLLLRHLFLQHTTSVIISPL